MFHCLQDWSHIQLTKFEKNFYIEHPDVSRLTPEEVDSIRRKHDITIVAGRNVPRPIGELP